METRANTRAAGAGATGRHHGGAEAVQFGLGLDDAVRWGNYNTNPQMISGSKHDEAASDLNAKHNQQRYKGVLST